MPGAAATASSEQSGSRIWTVTALARELGQRLEEEFPALWVRAEISGYKHHHSGHRYLTLKDGGAQFPAVLWRARAQTAEQQGVQLRDGLQVEALVRIVFYGPGGRLQLDIQRLRPAGLGELMQAYLELKERLTKEGLFDPAHKRPLPAMPECIGLLTAPGSAALADMLKIFKRRHPSVRLVLMPAPVQGPTAGPELARRLERLSREPGLDLIVLGRGGGSFEDLFCFNDEALLRAIHACPLPVVSAVGHEVDTPLSDLVADLRAPTPSAAAELVVPEDAELLQHLQHLRARARGAMQNRLSQEASHLRSLMQHRAMAEPLRLLREQRQKCDELQQQLVDGLTQRVTRHAEQLPGLGQRMRLVLRNLCVSSSGRLDALPRRMRVQLVRLQQQGSRELLQQGDRLERSLRQRLNQESRQLDGLAKRLRSAGSEGVLKRLQALGAALVSDSEGRPLRSARELQKEDILTLTFSDGRASVRVLNSEVEHEGKETQL